MTLWLIVPAAGRGQRMQADRPKQYLELNGRMLIDHTLSVILSYPLFNSAVLVLSDDDPYWSASLFADDAEFVSDFGTATGRDAIAAALRLGNG